MAKVFEWVRLGQGKRTLQVRCTIGGTFVCEAVEQRGDSFTGVILAKGEGKSGDSAIIQMSMSLHAELNRKDTPAEAAAKSEN